MMGVGKYLKTIKNIKNVYKGRELLKFGGSNLGFNLTKVTVLFVLGFYGQKVMENVSLNRK